MSAPEVSIEPPPPPGFNFFFFNETATTEIYTLSLHDALTTYIPKTSAFTLAFSTSQRLRTTRASARTLRGTKRSEERFSRNAETDLVCRLLLEKKKNTGSAQERAQSPTDDIAAWNT